MTHDPSAGAPLDLAGVGIGPANLSLAALAHPVPGLRTAFHDQRPSFHWHPGLLIEGTTLQVPFLADLVTLADPTSPFSFLSYLAHRQRLYPFYFAERLHPLRTEYDAYCRWVSGRLPSLRFGHRVEAVRWDAADGLFVLDVTRTGAAPGPGPDAAGEPRPAPCRVRARNVVLGVGTAPHVPEALRGQADDPSVPVVHSSDYLRHRDRLLAAGHVTVVGSGQSGAEVFLDLLRHRPAGAERLHWLARSPAFAPMEYSKLGLEHFTPDYTRYFHALPEPVRDALPGRQWQLYKAVDHQTLAAVHDELCRRSQHGGWPDTVLTPGVTVRAAFRTAEGRIGLDLAHAEQGTRAGLVTDAVVLATGYRERPLDRLLAPLGDAVRRDSAGRPRIDEYYRLVLDPSVTGAVFVQNAERHTHGVGAPDLGLVAHRSAVVLAALTGHPPYPLPERTAFTAFGLGQQPRADRRGPA